MPVFSHLPDFLLPSSPLLSPLSFFTRANPNLFVLLIPYLPIIEVRVPCQSLLYENLWQVNL